MKYGLYYLFMIMILNFNLHFHLKIIQNSTYGEILIYQKEEHIRTYDVIDHFK